MEKVNEKIYARVMHYNAVKMLNAISEMIMENGGSIISGYRSELSFTDVHCRKDTIRIGNPDDIIKDCPVITTPFWGCFTCYMNFELDGYAYYLEVPSNMFDDITYSKIKIDDNLVVTTKGYSTPIADSSKYIDVLYNTDPRTEFNEDIIRVAGDIASWLHFAPTNEYVVTEEVEVPNIYDNGYHIENKKVNYKKQYTRLDVKTGLPIEKK